MAEILNFSIPAVSNGCCQLAGTGSPATSSLSFLTATAGHRGGRQAGRQQLSNRSISSNTWSLAQAPGLFWAATDGYVCVAPSPEHRAAALTTCRGLNNCIFPVHQSWNGGEGTRDWSWAESCSLPFLCKRVNRKEVRTETKLLLWEQLSEKCRKDRGMKGKGKILKIFPT